MWCADCRVFVFVIFRLEDEAREMRLHLEAFKSMEGGFGGADTDGLFDDDDGGELLGMEEEDGGEADRIVASLPDDARELVQVHLIVVHTHHTLLCVPVVPRSSTSECGVCVYMYTRECV